ncbi:MAG: hypothetical protein QM779_13795 [Propionicimonas sp.]|uniref:hypothetical protein n=1 Tax=Propionicimonas sp. TaxID=1955623 RepID=UPI003D0D9A6A
MAIRCTPYHSIDLRDPRVCHDYRDCPNGEQIEKKNLASGTGGLPRCGGCKRLD